MAKRTLALTLFSFVFFIAIFAVKTVENRKIHSGQDVTHSPKAASAAGLSFPMCHSGDLAGFYTTHEFMMAMHVGTFY